MSVQDVKAPRLIARAKQAEKSGDIAGAEALYREVLARFPANRRAKEGIVRLRQANLPAQVEALLSLWRGGHVDAALAESERLPLSHPTVRDVRAAALRKRGRSAEAVDLYDAALKAEPENPWLWFNAGGARLECYRLSEAANHLEKACTLAPTADNFLTLAMCRLEQGYFEAAETLIASVLADPALSETAQAKAQNLYGRALLNLGKTDLAKAAFQEAKSLFPNDASILQNIAIAELSEGQFPQAEAAFRQAIAADPQQAASHRGLSGLITYGPDEPHFDQMQNLLKTELTPANESELLFALFKACDDHSDYAQAANYLKRANSLRARVLAHDPNWDTALRQRLTNFAPTALADKPSSSPSPIFLLGMPRSGTTLTEQIISGAPGVMPAGELPYVAQAGSRLLRAVPEGPVREENLCAFREDVQKGLQSRGGDCPVVVDKMPLNFRWVEVILSAMPDARIVWMHRDPLANAFSLYRQCFIGGGNGFSCHEDTIAEMMDWERDMRRAACARWPERVHVLKLEDLTHDPEPHIRTLISFCQLHWSDACLAPQSRRNAVLTASSQQVRSAIAPAKDDYRTHYEPYLSELRHALERRGLLSCARGELATCSAANDVTSPFLGPCEGI